MNKRILNIYYTHRGRQGQHHRAVHSGCLQVLRVVSLGMAAASCCFSPDGQRLAVGLQCGGIKVLAFQPGPQQVWWGKPSGESIDVIKYSPDGRWLAAGECGAAPGCRGPAEILH